MYIKQYLLIVSLSLLTINLTTSCDEGLSIGDENNSPPTCNITSPENGSEFTLGETITINVNAEDEDNNLRDVSFYANDIGLAVRNSFPYNYEWDTDYEEFGVYTIKVKVTDHEEEKYIAEINITLNNIISNETVTDIDGNVYSTAVIGDQLWMAENLKTTKYNDGSPIELGTDIGTWLHTTEGAYCWYDNDKDQFAETYGALYNWYTVETGNLCPEGWHVPSDEEWKTLEIFLGMVQSDVDDTGWRGMSEGSLLAGNSSLWSDGDLVSDNEFGLSNFKALPGGIRKYDASFEGLGSNAFFWTSTKSNDTQAWYRNLNKSNTKINRADYEIDDYGCSVRCVKD